MRRLENHLGEGIHCVQNDTDQAFLIELEGRHYEVLTADRRSPYCKASEIRFLNSKFSEKWEDQSVILYLRDIVSFGVKTIEFRANITQKKTRNRSKNASTWLGITTDSGSRNGFICIPDNGEKPKRWYVARPFTAHHAVHYVYGETKPERYQRGLELYALNPVVVRLRATQKEYYFVEHPNGSLPEHTSLNTEAAFTHGEIQSFFERTSFTIQSWQTTCGHLDPAEQAPDPKATYFVLKRGPALWPSIEGGDNSFTSGLCMRSRGRVGVYPGKVENGRFIPASKHTFEALAESERLSSKHLYVAKLR